MLLAWWLSTFAQVGKMDLESMDSHRSNLRDVIDDKVETVRLNCLILGTI